jgi:hypothetical protein
MLIPRAGDGPSHHLQGPDGTRWTGANRGNVVSSGRDDIAASCLLNRQDTFWSIIESVEMHVQVVTRHAIAAGIVWSVACHVTQPPMRASSLLACVLCAPGWHRLPVKGARAHAASVRTLGRPSAPRLPSALPSHQRWDLETRCWDDTDGRLTVDSSRPQHPPHRNQLRKASQSQAWNIQLPVRSGAAIHSFCPFGPVCLVSQLSCGTSCPSLQLRFLTRRSPFAAITRSP